MEEELPHYAINYHHHKLLFLLPIFAKKLPYWVFFFPNDLQLYAKCISILSMILIPRVFFYRPTRAENLENKVFLLHFVNKKFSTCSLKFSRNQTTKHKKYSPFLKFFIPSWTTTKKVLFLYKCNCYAYALLQWWVALHNNTKENERKRARGGKREFFSLFLVCIKLPVCEWRKRRGLHELHASWCILRK